MTAGILLIMQVILYHMTAAAVYNYNETSEVILDELDPTVFRGFRNITDKDFIIGGLFPLDDCNRDSDLEDLDILEAMLFAVDQINSDVNLLPNLTIGYDVRDSCNISGFAVFEANDFVENYIFPEDNSTPLFLGIVGPAYTTVSNLVALYIGIYHIPVISYASPDAALSNKDLYEYFLRTIPSDNLQVNAMVDLVSYFRWEYVSMIFNDNGYGVSASNAFNTVAAQHNICLDAKIDIPPEFNQTVVKAAIRTLLNSTASVVVVFADEGTVLALFEELNKTNSTQKFVWIASDKWANSHLVHKKFPELQRELLVFSFTQNMLKSLMIIFPN